MLDVVFWDDAPWGSLGFALVTEQRLAPEQASALYADLEAWARVAFEGGFGGTIKMEWVDLGYALTADGEPALVWSVDMGDAPGAALEVLINLVASVCEHRRLRPVRLEIGHPPYERSTRSAVRRPAR